MSYEVVIAQDWTYRDHKRGLQVVAAGTYRVPEQMKEAVAKMAIQRGAGVKRKASPPKNKALRAAPSNKAALG